MWFINFLGFFAQYLIEIMGVGLMIALGFRYMAFRSGKRDRLYFKTFSSSVENLITTEKIKEDVKNVEPWMDELLDQVLLKLPERNLRGNAEAEGSFRSQGRGNLTDFVEGKRSIIMGVKQNLGAFKSPHPPNFSELTSRILAQDKKWTTIAGFIPTTTLGRFLDILPGLFIVGGIFGTFIGITGALPRIAEIDLSKLDEAGPIINAFVASVAYSMNTSISGIIYNVIMTLLNTAFPITAVREEVHKSLERSFEFMWYHIHGDKLSKGEQQMIDLLEKMAVPQDNSVEDSKPNLKVV